MKSKNPKALIQEVELEDSEEVLIAHCFILSLEAQVSFCLNYTCNYWVVRDFCKKEKLDPIEILRILKEMLKEFVHD